MTERQVSFDTQDPFVRPLVEGSARAALELFDEHPGPAGVTQVVSELHAFAGEMARTLTSQVEAVRRLPIACTSGCSYCCRGTPVLVSAPEAIHLAEHLRSTRTPDELGAVVARVEATFARVKDLDIDARAEEKVPCPLLDEATGACTVYDARPVACRAYNSCDAARCAEAHDAGLASPVLPSNPILFQATHAAGFGLMLASRLRDRETGPYELVNALRTALAEPTASSAWLEGKTVFSHTRLSDEGAIAYGDLIDRLADDFRGGRMRDTEKAAIRVDPDAKRRDRNRRKALSKKR